MSLETALALSVFVALVAIAVAYRNAQALSHERKTVQLLEDHITRLPSPHTPKPAVPPSPPRLGSHAPVSLFPPRTSAPDLWVSRVECLRLVLEYPLLASRSVEDITLAQKVKSETLVTTTQLFLAAAYVAKDASPSPVSKWRKQLTPHLNKHFGRWPHTVAEWRVFFNTKWPSFLRDYLQRTELTTASLAPVLEGTRFLDNLLAAAPLPTTEAGWVSLLEKRGMPEKRDREATD